MSAEEEFVAFHNWGNYFRILKEKSNFRYNYTGKFSRSGKDANIDSKAQKLL